MAFGIDDAIAAGLKVLDKFVPDPNAKAQYEAELRDALRQWDQQQSDTNTAEASNPNMFVSGWRPAIGWIRRFSSISCVHLPLVQGHMICLLSMPL